jgi:hypothetical protein
VFLENSIVDDFRFKRNRSKARSTQLKDPLSDFLRLDCDNSRLNFIKRGRNVLNLNYFLFIRLKLNHYVLKNELFWIRVEYVQDDFSIDGVL